MLTSREEEYRSYALVNGYAIDTLATLIKFEESRQWARELIDALANMDMGEVEAVALDIVYQLKKGFMSRTLGKTAHAGLIEELETIADCAGGLE